MKSPPCGRKAGAARRAARRAPTGRNRGVGRFASIARSAGVASLATFLFCSCAPAPAAEPRGISPQLGSPTAAATPVPTTTPEGPVLPTPEETAALDALLRDTSTLKTLGLTPGDATRLLAAYGGRGPVWVNSAAGGGPGLATAIALMRHADEDGLHPEDYQADELATSASSFGRATPEASALDGTHERARQAARLDIEMTQAFSRFLRHLHRGHANPREVGFQVTLPADEHDYAAVAIRAAREGNVATLKESLEPPLVQYRLLRSELPRFRALAAREGRDLPALGAPPRKSLRPGDRAAGLAEVRERLSAWGDLGNAALAVPDANLYDEALAAGVRAFQARMGYEADGVLGRSTWAALATPFPWRLRQIELALERLRWLPHLGERPFLAVNIPMFRLFAWGSVPASGAPEFSMGVIVGRALKTGTPVFVEEMEYVIFQPYWNVPRSILQKELLPLIRKDPSYLAREEMEIVQGPGDDGRVLEATDEALDRLARGELRLRQRPGRKNALGPVKFMFPNDDNVYLHGTPAPALFGRARRDFSHGCVRVEDPFRLARFVLRDQPEWTDEAIGAAMQGRPSKRVSLTRPLRVVMYYVTAAVIPGEGLRFADDIYNHDRKLDAALRARHAREMAPRAPSPTAR